MAISAPPGAAFPSAGQAGITVDTGPLLERAEAAERLRVSEATVRRLTAAGHLTEVRVSERSPRITVSSVEAHIARRTVRREEAVTAA
jgi:excisionase family DNA binding protein